MQHKFSTSAYLAALFLAQVFCFGAAAAQSYSIQDIFDGTTCSIPTIRYFVAYRAGLCVQTGVNASLLISCAGGPNSTNQNWDNSPRCEGSPTSESSIPLNVCIASEGLSYSSRCVSSLSEAFFDNSSSSWNTNATFAGSSCGSLETATTFVASATNYCLTSGSTGSYQYVCEGQNVRGYLWAGTTCSGASQTALISNSSDCLTTDNGVLKPFCYSPVVTIPPQTAGSPPIAGAPQSTSSPQVAASPKVAVAPQVTSAPTVASSPADAGPTAKTPRSSANSIVAFVSVALIPLAVLAL